MGDGDTARLRGVGMEDIANLVGVYLRTAGVVSPYLDDGVPDWECWLLVTSTRFTDLGVLAGAKAADTDDQRGLPTGSLKSRTKSSRLSRNGSARRREIGVVTLRGVRRFDVALDVALGMPLGRLRRLAPLPN